MNNGSKRHVINRRAFLYGVGGIAIGLPFLEGLPERSAWAANDNPIFTFFMCAACGVEPKRFWPTDTGDLSTVLAAASDKALGELKEFSDNLMIVKNINFPQTGPAGCGHAEGLSQALTGVKPKGNGGTASGGGPSADYVISQAVNPAGLDPLTLYGGNLRNGYIAERLSFDGSKVRAANDNPYRLYQQLVGLAKPAGSDSGTGGSTGMGTGGSTSNPVADELIRKRKSVNDHVRAELNSLMQNPKISSDDKQRLQQHFQSIRDIENTMMNMGQQMAVAGCTFDGIDVTVMDALKTWKYNKTNVVSGGMENIVELHLQLVALAFACNVNRTGTLQWGDGTDATIYQTASNKTLGNWGFHFISHRVQSDSATGQNATAEAAHAEIDILRMQTLAKGLRHFKARGLQDKAVVLWTNHVAEGNHTMKNVPMILWGNGGGYLKQGQYVDGGGATNAVLLNTVINAATGSTSGSFGSSAGKELDAIKA